MEIRSKIKMLTSGELGDVLSHAKNYFTGNFATKALGLVSMPVFTRLMDREDYGIVSIFTASLGLITILSTLNLNDGIGRYYYQKEKTDFNEFLSSVIKFILWIQIPFILVVIIFRHSILPIIGLPENLLLFFILGMFGLTSMKLFLGTHVPQKKSKLVAKVSVIESYGGFALSWLLLIFFSFNRYILRITGFVIASFISGVYMAVQTLKQVKWGAIKKEHIKYSLNFSLPRLPYVLSGTILSQFDRIMLGSLKGATDAGLYSVAYNVGGLSMIFIGAISSALIPNFYQLMNETKFKEVDSLNLKLFWIVVAAGCGLMVFGGVVLRLLADAKFHEGVYMIPLITLGYMFYSLAGVYNRYVGYYKITIMQSFAAIGAGVLNIVLNYNYIPVYGMKAAAFTTAIAYAFQAIATWILVTKTVKGHTTSMKIFILPVLVAVLVCVLTYIFYK